MSSKEELYKLLVDKAPYGTLFFAYGVCIDSNPRALAILGCQEKQLVGASLDEITGNESTALVDLKLQLKKAIRDGKTELNWQCPVEEGSRSPIDLSVIYASEDAKEMIVTLHPQGQVNELTGNGSNEAVVQSSSPQAAAANKKDLLAEPATPKGADDIPSFIQAPAYSSGLTSELQSSLMGAGQPASSGEVQSAPLTANAEAGQDLHISAVDTLADDALVDSVLDADVSGLVVPSAGLEAELAAPILTDEVAAGELLSDDMQPDKVSAENTSQPGRDYYFDTLTGLPNRQRLLQSIQNYFQLKAGEELCGAALMIDLDNFKDINDSWGHSVGDQVVKKVGRAIAGLVTGDKMLARMSGDEFVLFVPSISENISQAAWDAQDLAERVRDVVASPIFLDGHEVILTASIGIALVTDSSLTAERVLQYADTAMYEAKRKGRNGIAFFDPCITEKAQRQIGMNTRLRKAIDNQEFALYIQPQICVDSGELQGGEALLRWINSDKVTNMPAEFIPVLESSGLIIDVGHWVIRTACEYIRSFIDDGIWKDHMRLGINISPRQFRDPQLLEVVDHSLKSYNINPRFLNFEITENLVIDDVDEAIQKMHTIKGLGSTFSIDDFGIGYSSMIYLKRLPFDQLKIDREFIRNISRDQESRGMVEAIMAVSRQYGLSVMAEGVENKESLDVLRRVGCDAYQGAHYSMPVPVDRFRKMLAA